MRSFAWAMIVLLVVFTLIFILVLFERPITTVTLIAALILLAGWIGSIAVIRGYPYGRAILALFFVGTIFDVFYIVLTRPLGGRMTSQDWGTIIVCVAVLFFMFKKDLLAQK